MEHGGDATSMENIICIYIVIHCTIRRIHLRQLHLSECLLLQFGKSSSSDPIFTFAAFPCGRGAIPLQFQVALVTSTETRKRCINFVEQLFNIALWK